MLKKVLIGFFALIAITFTGLYFLFLSVQKSLPEVIKIEDYNTVDLC